MSSTVSLAGPINTSITLRYGSTGLPIVNVLDPQYPTGGYGGPLDAGQLSQSITKFRANIDFTRATIRDLESEITKVQLSNASPEVKAATVKQLQQRITDENNRITNFSRSITIAEYLLSNVSSLTAKLKAAQEQPNTNVSVANSPNTKPTTTAVTSTSNSTAISTDPSINKLLSTKSLVDAQGQPTSSSDPSINKLLTDGNKPLVDETGAVKPTDPSITALLDTPPIVEIDEAKLQQDIANLQAELPPLPNIEEEVVTFAAQQDATAFEAKADWRVRLSLSPDANYLYRADNPGILSPLAATDGVVFPYTPTISLNYVANYDPTTLVHSNYKVYQYSSSSVEQVSIACEFTAQDVYEANYLLAVIHFFRSMTKMFYGQDEDPRRGTPPPLCYMFGMGNYQFSAHPLAITGFTYNLPNNVDYIKTVGETFTGIPQPSGKLGTAVNRLLGTGVAVGGKKPKATLNNPPNSTGEATWVPTQIQIQITCLPIQTRNMVSNVFSLKEYATGSLLNGTRSGATGGGFW